MANKVYNLNGGLYSGDAFTAFETRIASSNNGSIVASPSDLKVSAGSGMNVTVSTGAGIIGNGTLSGVRFAIDAPATVAVNAASTANPRMDSVVAYIDKSVSASTSVVDNTDLGIVKFKSVAGTPASTPTAPSASTIQSSIGAGNPYMVLANITVPKSSTAASSFKIADTRITPTSAIITDNSITTSKLADKAVTSNKINWTTFPGNYTTSETDTRQTWVDGRKIYKRTVVFNQLGNSVPSEQSVTGVGKVVDFKATMFNGSNSWKIPYKFVDRVSYEQGKLIINSLTDLRQYSAAVTIYYVKQA